jgi:hypothetical protein
LRSARSAGSACMRGTFCSPRARTPCSRPGAGIAVEAGREPWIKTVVTVAATGRTSAPRVWAAGTVAGTSMHTIVVAGDGARVAINIVSEQRGERRVDHDCLENRPAPASAG